MFVVFPLIVIRVVALGTSTVFMLVFVVIDKVVERDYSRYLHELIGFGCYLTR